MEASTGVSFPVVFHDGQTEARIGDVVVSPSFDFKTFRSILSSKIGISSSHFSTYLVADRRKLGSKIPITAKVDFEAVSRWRGSFFLVVLKRSRRYRRKQNNGPDEIKNKNTKPTGNVMLLRRGDSISPAVEKFRPFRVADWSEYENRLRALQMDRERYLMNMRLDSLSLGKDQSALIDGSVGSEGDREAVCEVCQRAKEMGVEAEFHCCVNDPIVAHWYRSTAGQIARPIERSD